MDTNLTPRMLTHDERKAAEAAFAGRPFNPAWSESAKKVYEGLTEAMPTLPSEAGTPGTESLPIASESQTDALQPSEEIPIKAATPETQMASRQQAIDSGVLIDVTTDAKKLGLSFSVTVTKPLWEVGIAPSQELSEEDKSARLRDVLMAFRLRLANQGTLSPLLDFPAMLSMPPGAIPQPVPLFALIQPGEHNQAMVTLLLPNEISTTIIPMN
ncbi:MAG: hypothetical protein OEW13_06175 [Nitrospira sp.]|nr:hypothetical protein [Nitrospira sp.]MDH5496166.1 hypothetical protein [Nitrospira sp.]